MDEALFIAIAALLISVLSFYYQHLRKGNILFGEPNIHFLWKEEKDFLMAFPLALTNTGSYSHTINFLHGILYSLSEDKEYEFQVSKIFRDFSVDDEETASEFVGIEVGPRASVTKLISFKAKKQYIPEGEFIFELSGCLDGTTFIEENLLSFSLEIDEKDRKGLIPNTQSKVHHFEYETLKEMSKQKKRKHLIILWVLRSLSIGQFLSFFIIILVSNYTTQLQNPASALISLLVLASICTAIWLFYEGSLVQIKSKTIKQTKARRKV